MTLHVTYLPDITTNNDVDQLFAVILYTKRLEKMLRMVRPRNKKMFRDRTETTLFGPELYQYLFRYYL